MRVIGTAVAVLMAVTAGGFSLHVRMNDIKVDMVERMADVARSTDRVEADVRSIMRTQDVILRHVTKEAPAGPGN